MLDKPPCSLSPPTSKGMCIDNLHSLKAAARADFTPSVYHISHVTHFISQLTAHISYIAPHVPHIFDLTSHIACRISHPHTFHLAPHASHIVRSSFRAWPYVPLPLVAQQSRPYPSRAWPSCTGDAPGSCESADGEETVSARVMRPRSLILVVIRVGMMVIRVGMMTGGGTLMMNMMIHGV